MRKFMLVLVGCLIGLLIAAVLLVGGLYWASQQQPKFYQEALVASPQKQREASDQLLAQAAALQSTARREGDWEAVFTAEQLNGWLAVDLIENHPTVLPKEIRSPRVAFKPQEVLVGWTLAQSGIETVCSLRASVSMPEPNVLAIRLHDAYAGSIPLPLGQILDVVRDRAAEAKINLEWKQADGDPVAIVTLPSVDEDGVLRRLDALEVQDGKVYISGGVDSPAQAADRRDRAAMKKATAPTEGTSRKASDADEAIGDHTTSDKHTTSDEHAATAEEKTPLVARSQTVGAASAAKARRSRAGRGGFTYSAF